MKSLKISLSVSISLLLCTVLLITNYSVLVTYAAESGYLQAFISKQITKKQIRKYLRQSSNVKSMKSDSRFRLVYEAPETEQVDGVESMDLNGTIDLSSSSIVNFLRYGDEKFQAGIDINGKMYGEVMSFNGEIRMVNETLYGILNSITGSLAESSPELAEVQGKWYSYKIQNMDEIRKLFANSSNSKINSTISEEDLDKLVTLLTDDVIQKRYTKSTYTTSNGVKSTCINFKYNGAQFYQLVTRIAEINSTVGTYSEDSSVYDPLKNLEFGFCTDANMKNLYKSYLNLLIESEETGKAYIEFEQLTTDHNADLAVLAPTNAEPIDSKINSKLDSAGLDLASIERNMDEMNSTTQACNNLGGSVFPDVTDTFNEYDSIVYSKQNAIINGYSDGCFRPYNEITREQLIAILIRGKHTQQEIQSCTDMSFADVDSTNKLKGEICIAKKLNYVGGYSDGSFRPSRNITVEEASKMIANVYGINDAAVDNTNYPFNSYMTALDEKHALPEVLGCKSDVALRADITEIIYRLRSNISNKEYSTFESLKQC